jgi:hypothetical protein
MHTAERIANRSSQTASPLHAVHTESHATSAPPVGMGNQAMQRRLIQAKLPGNQPGDSFEQEVDRVAELTGHGGGPMLLSAATPSQNTGGSLQRLDGNQSALQMPHGSCDQPALLVPLRPSQSRILQRKCACGGSAGMSGECEECGEKQRLGLQTKLKVNEPGDTYEQEADRIAEQVLATPTHPAVSGAPLRIQRFVGQSTGQTQAAPTSVAQALASSGRPLEPALRQDMEQRFGQDFSQVRVHTDAKAAESARAVNALAYTVGRSVVFGAGQFAPETTTGRGLLAHELVHVIQQAALDGSLYNLNGAFLQRRLVTESAGGCGLCQEARFVGTEVHQLIQFLSFRPEVHTEFPIGFTEIDEENGDMDGRLDLLEVIVNPAHRTIEANIGEIKPNNYRGIKAGVKDLLYYEAAVHFYFKTAFPDYSVFVGRLDIAPNPAILPYTETQGCPTQAIEVENAHDGLYLYNCSLTRAQLSGFRDCCEEQQEEKNQQIDALLLHQQTYNLAEKEEKKEKKATGGARGAAAAAAGFAARGNALARVAEAHVKVYGALAEYAYTSMYEGTRGYNLNEQLSELAEQGQLLALVTASAVALESDLALIEALADTEAETAEVRAELTRIVGLLINQIYRAFRALEDAGSYSAIEKRIDLRVGDQYNLWIEKDNALTTGLGITWGSPRDNSASSLSILTDYEARVAEWLLTQIERILNDRMGVIKDDQRAWLQLRR